MQVTTLRRPSFRLSGRSAIIALLLGTWAPEVLAQFAQQNRTAARLSAKERAEATDTLLTALKAKLEIKLDREQYLAGERARVTLAVSNPGLTPLTVFDPFEGRATCLIQEVWSGESVGAPDWNLTDPESSCEGYYIDGSTLALDPGQRIEKALPAPEPGLLVPAPPNAAGRFRMSFCYRVNSRTCAEGEFTVVEPIFRGSAVVKLKKPFTDPVTGQETQESRYINSFVLEHDNKRYLCVQQEGSRQHKLLLDLDAKLDNGNATELGAYDRVTEAGPDPQSLHITADEDENLTLSWTENGQPKSHCVSKDRSQIGPCGQPNPIQVAISPAAITLTAFQSQQFMATVTNTTNKAVTWSISPSVGTVSESGFYSAPSSIAAQQDVTVTAQSQADSTKSASGTVTLSSQEAISPAPAPSGPASGVSGTLYKFTGGGATSSLGHTVQYSFNWGDGSASGWTPQSVTSSFHTWPSPGGYNVSVQARCVTHPDVLSAVSPAQPIVITGESIGAPSAPAGPASAVSGTSYTYSTGASTSSLGHPVQYKIFWGDGSTSVWLASGATSASHGWPGPGTYTVTAQARCATDKQVLSPGSAGTTVTVAPGETISAPSPPGGQAGVNTGVGATFTASGAASSLGHGVQYLFDWGDGSNSGWLAPGASAAAHAWPAAGSYSVTAQARCASDWLILSPVSAAVVVAATAP